MQIGEKRLQVVVFEKGGYIAGIYVDATVMEE